jgi:cob(I)alamin adenosyltransferase
VPGRAVLNDERVTELEHWLDRLNADLAPLREFILPGGSRAAALCHLARTVCRRAERRVFTLSRAEAVAPATLRYFNRLSDYLFVLARTLNRAAGVPDVLWRPTPPSG